MADIFISYKKEDRAFADMVVAAIERQGFSVWWDQDITPRESWDGMIQREAEAAKAVVVLWTPRSIASEWVRAEAGFGRSRNKLIPLMLEACELPIAFSMIQSANLADWRGDTDHPEWRRALSWIADQCQKQPVPIVSPTPPARRWPWIVAAAVLSAGALAIAVMVWPRPTQPDADTLAVPAPLPEGPMGEVETARRAFLAEPSAPACEARVDVLFLKGAEPDPDSLAAAAEAMEGMSACEKSAILLAGHADAAEPDPFAIARARAEALARQADWLPAWGVEIASVGAEELAMQTPAGISLKQNRRVHVSMRGLPREQVRDAAYKALGLADPRDRAQPFSRILFGDDRSAIDLDDDTTRTIIQTWRDILVENPDVTIVIIGTVDDQMTREYAIALGARRAGSIEDYLISLGADRKQITTMSFGKEKPADIDPSLPAVVRRMANRSAFIRIEK
jgi:outer membrane protein OmpA-like peptidoglycan-associated protein